jgi:two-component system phosphate regulon sensor histidine kinase PhoR
MGLFTRQGDLIDSTTRLEDVLDAALRVSEIAASNSALNDSLDHLLRSAVDLLGADEGAMLLLDDDGRALVLEAFYGAQAGAVRGQRVGVADGVVGRVLATVRPLLLEGPDAAAWPRPPGIDTPVASGALVPLRVQGRCIGVLALAMNRGHASFTEEDLRVAQLFADQAAGVIFRASLHQRAEQRSSDLTALVESSRGLVGALDVDALLQRVLDGAARLAGAASGFACLFKSDDTASIDRGVFRGLGKPAIARLAVLPEVRAAAGLAQVVGFEGGEDGTGVVLGLRTGRGTAGAVVLLADADLIAERTGVLHAFAQQAALALGGAELHGEVRRKEQELATIIDGVPNPIILVDEDKRIVALNPAAEQVFHVSSTFCQGAPAEGTLSHEGVEALLTGEGDVVGEVEAGISLHTYKVRAGDVRMPDRVVGRLLIMDDVTSEREASQIQRDFVAMIGHELRTPLTVVKGFARTLLRKVDSTSTEQMSEMLSTIDTKAGQLEHLIEDLLYVSRIESREASLRIEELDFGNLVEAVAGELVREHADREVQLDMREDLIWPCDESKLVMILRHLIENALKYSEAPSPVVVRAIDDEEELRIDVVDRGVGIVSTDLPHIFKRFRQVDSTSTREHGGAGVGLYLTAQLVRAHGGRIWADSIWGKGSTFSISLPRHAAQRKVVRVRRSDQPQTLAQ